VRRFSVRVRRRAWGEHCVRRTALRRRFEADTFRTPRPRAQLGSHPPRTPWSAMTCAYASSVIVSARPAWRATSTTARPSAISSEQKRRYGAGRTDACWACRPSRRVDRTSATASSPNHDRATATPLRFGRRARVRLAVRSPVAMRRGRWPAESGDERSACVQSSWSSGLRRSGRDR
jgi:hypothetical protein